MQHCFLRQLRLPHAWLPGDQHQVAGSGHHIRRGQDAPELLLTSDKRSLRQGTQEASDQSRVSS
jgi:hypothetical protein